MPLWENKKRMIMVTIEQNVQKNNKKHKHVIIMSKCVFDKKKSINVV
jgi:hypothetical protein